MEKIESLYKSALHLISTGDFAGAKLKLLLLLKKSPAYAPAYYQMALINLHQDDDKQAIANLIKCIDININTSNAALLLAETQLRNSQLTEALATYTKTALLKDFKQEAISGQAKSLRLLDRTQEAYDLIQQEVDITDHPSLILAFSEICIELKCYSEATDKIERLLSKENMSDIEVKKNLLHTLGKLYDKEKKYKESFKAHKDANNLTPHLYLPNNFNQLTFRIQNTYSEDFINHFPKSNNKSKHQPIFIVGMPRSGTSLLEQILCSHSEIYGAGERNEVQQAISFMCKGGYPEKMQAITSAQLDQATKFYTNSVCSKRHKYTIDKMPHNYLHIGAILQLFPESKIINITRDPIDNCLSIYFQYFNSSHRYATKLDNIAHHYSRYNMLVSYWKQLFPDNLINIKYENIINNTESEIKSLLNHLSLEWEDGCLEHYKNKRHVKTASQQQVNQPIYNESVSRWKNYEDDIQPLLTQLKSYDLI
ncbi:MAG: hypothetical protein DIZ80_12885 [endosymbiont of Galathealinum brachiosum]|uniref:Sulfotransferase family protein n=1 Tax=endosymbiont of Galathealinum brachiosum TaxID=2200906 RepID=A0A370D7U6_9GAMM|nr:MAG: hypothetical protein DIZ80_12885 [endosymbiont of Galathealinum brachiosum]